MRTLDKAQKYAYLNKLSTPELENILRADMASHGEGDIDMVLYIMEVIEQREGGKSSESIADTERARGEFDRIYNTPESGGRPLYTAGSQGKLILQGDMKNPEKITVLTDSTHTATKPNRLHRVMRVGLIAAITAVVMLGVMVVAQAAGVDVFGAVARWTDEVFSLGTIRYQSAVDINLPNDTADTSDIPSPQVADEEGASTYTSIQDALDACGITVVAAPTWIPEGYSFDGVDVLYNPDGSFLMLSGGYLKENKALNISVEHYEDEPRGQIEKTDAPVETFTLNGITVYLLENINSNTAVWATEHYAYYIDCCGDKDNVKKMAISAIENVK